MNELFGNWWSWKWLHVYDSDASVPSTSFLDQNNNSTSTTNCDGKDKVEVNGIESFCEVDDLIEEILLFTGSKNVSANIIHDLQCIRRDIRMYSVHENNKKVDSSISSFFKPKQKQKSDNNDNTNNS